MNNTTTIQPQHLSLITRLSNVGTLKLTLYGAGALLLCLVISLAITAINPPEAHAIAPIIIGGGLIISAIAGIALGGGAASEWLSDLFRNGINGLLDMMSSMVAMTVNGDTLTARFSDLLSGVYPIIYYIHHIAVMPMAYIVAAICLVVGLIKIFSEAGQHEASVDLYKVVMTFMLFAVGFNAINYSFEIMLAIYSIITNFINAILSAGGTALGASFHPVDSDVGDLGILFTMFISAFFAWIVTVGVFLLSQAAILVRSIQIYAMTCFSPPFLACFVNETSRPTATGYLKKYIATVGAGALLALLFIMFAAVAGSTATTSVAPDSAENIMRWCLEVISSLITLVAFGFCIFKSGSWVRDWIGV